MNHAAAQAKGPEGRFLVVMASCVGVFAVAYNTTAVMTILPAIKSSFDLDDSTLEWVINIYLVSTAIVLAAMGHFADMFGMLRIFAIGVAVFAFGSIVCGLSDGAALMLLGRAFQGTGVAGLLATSVALINIAIPKDKRAEGVGLWAASVAMGFALGPLIGGVLTDAVGWRAVFAFDLLILGTAGVLCFFVGRSGLVPRALETGTRVDFPGIVLLAVALGCLLYGLTSGQLTGWTSVQTLTLLAVVALASAAFAVREATASDPLVNFRFFRHADYAAGTSGMILNGFAQIGVLYFFNLFLQSPEGLNFSAGQAGLALLPFTLAMLAVSLAGPRLLPADRLGQALVAAMTMLAVGFWLMRTIDSDTAYSEIWWKLTIVGAGIGLCWALLPRVGMRSLPDANAGQASGVITTCNFIGLASGTAVGGVVASAIKRGEIDPVLSRLAPKTADLDALEVTLVHGSDGAIASALAKLSPDDAKKLQNMMQPVVDHALSGVMVMMAIAGLVGVVLCAVLVGRRGGCARGR